MKNNNRQPLSLVPPKKKEEPLTGRAMRKSILMGLDQQRKIERDYDNLTDTSSDISLVSEPDDVRTI
jgi:hypothetical protein